MSQTGYKIITSTESRCHTKLYLLTDISHVISRLQRCFLALFSPNNVVKVRLWQLDARITQETNAKRISFRIPLSSHNYVKEIYDDFFTNYLQTTRKLSTISEHSSFQILSLCSMFLLFFFSPPFNVCFDKLCYVLVKPAILEVRIFPRNTMMCMFVMNQKYTYTFFFQVA